MEEVKIKPIYPININRWWVGFTSKELNENKDLLFLADGKILRVSKIVFWVNAKNVLIDQYILKTQLYANENCFRIMPCGVNVFLYLRPFHRLILADLFKSIFPPASLLLESGLIWLFCYLWQSQQISPEEILDSKKHPISDFEELVKDKFFCEVFGIDFKHCVFCGESTGLISKKIFSFKINDKDFTYTICKKCAGIFDYLLVVV